ncbi:NADP-dependent oxidoreductase [Streptomyces sp. NPDC005407]|uniref:NADP-dependent oxidoreductase n=1 Tax=Streptomyces sp. NPDC005407 TaxID=3155340 RepID=UPI0033BED1CB
MEAIVFEQFGGPEVLRLTEAEEPHAGPGQVRVRIKAAGVNPADYKIRYGWMQEVFPMSLPATPGLEFSGIVDEVGEGVTGAAVGDEVLGWTVTGAYAQYALAESFAPKPAELDWAAAAALPVATETAQRVLDLLGVQAGETLLLHGAAGAVGAAATQLAVAAGVTVIGTASTAGHDYLRELGATPVAYGDGLVARVREAAPQGVDAVFDAAGKGALPDSIELRGGTTDRIITIADPEAAAHGVTFSGGGTEAPETALAEHARLAANGRLRIPVVEVFPLQEAAKAQALSETGHVRGKLVVTP